MGDERQRAIHARMAQLLRELAGLHDELADETPRRPRRRSTYKPQHQPTELQSREAEAILRQKGLIQ